jgi:hypothetical protein
MLEIITRYEPTFEKGLEHIRRKARSFSVRDELAQRRNLTTSLHRQRALDGMIDERTGYSPFSAQTIPSIVPAITFAQAVRADRHARMSEHKKGDYNPTIHAPKRYEDAPEFFDLALSDQIIQIASDYLGEIPVLLHIKLWCTPVNDHMKGSQLYHRDGRQWTLRRAKFLINMDDVDADCGPFTFLPADVTERVSNSIGGMKRQGRVTDEMIYQRHAQRSDSVSLIGPAGTGAAVDSSRCFHHGARVRKGERLLLMFHFLRLSDAMHGGQLYRSPGFQDRFGNDTVRRLLVPNEAPLSSAADDDD